MIKIKSKELDDYLKKISSRMKNLRPIFELMIPVIHNSVSKNFDVGGRPKKWKPLARSTIEKREFRGTMRGSQPILQEYLSLRRSIGSVREISDKSLVYGTNYSTAAIHQEGATIKGVTIPARPFMMIQPEDAEFITEVFSKWISRD